ncbi:Tn3 family transposase [Streptomyces sp. NPDC090445]|uniref:Tn3 family transposase n=1 Tax=Streptomyces sp. NPDC090445 TaxID=3365963 RepID=UPI0038244532
MNRQFIVQEARHRLVRAVCHGGRGQIRQAYREGQEDQLAALRLVLNAVVPWKPAAWTPSSPSSAARATTSGTKTWPRLSPLKYRHISVCCKTGPVTALEDVTAFFARADASKGGGLYRSAIVAQLAKVARRIQGGVPQSLHSRGGSASTAAGTGRPSGTGATACTRPARPDSRIAGWRSSPACPIR